MIEGEDDASSGPKRNGHHFLVRLSDYEIIIVDGPQAGTAGLPNWMIC